MTSSKILSDFASITYHISSSLPSQRRVRLFDFREHMLPVSKRLAHLNQLLIQVSLAPHLLSLELFLHLVQSIVHLCELPDFLLTFMHCCLSLVDRRVLILYGKRIQTLFMSFIRTTMSTLYTWVLRRSHLADLISRLISPKIYELRCKWVVRATDRLVFDLTQLQSAKVIIALVAICPFVMSALCFNILLRLLPFNGRLQKVESCLRHLETQLKKIRCVICGEQIGIYFLFWS